MQESKAVILTENKSLQMVGDLVRITDRLTQYDDDLQQWWDGLHSDWKMILREQQFFKRGSNAGQRYDPLSKSFEDWDGRKFGLRNLQEIDFVEVDFAHAEKGSDFLVNEPFLMLKDLRALNIILDAENRHRLDMGCLQGLSKLKRFSVSNRSNEFQWDHREMLNRIIDFGSIRNLSQLESLSLYNLKIHDLSPLGELKNLKSLWLNFVPSENPQWLGSIAKLENLERIFVVNKTQDPILEDLEGTIFLNPVDFLTTVKSLPEDFDAERFKKNNPKCNLILSGNSRRPKNR